MAHVLVGVGRSALRTVVARPWQHGIWARERMLGCHRGFASPMVGAMQSILRPFAAFAVVASFAVGLIVVNGIAVPPPALASSCSDATGGDNDRLIKANNSNTGAGGWNCAYVYSTGDSAIGALDSAVVEDVSENGYQRTYDCIYESDSNMSIYRTYVDGGGKLGSSMTWSASNSNTGTRHWTGAILWMTKKYSEDPLDGQYLENCNNSTIGYNAMFQTNLSWSSTTAAGTSMTTGTVVPVTLKLTGEGSNPPDGSVLYVFQSTDPNSTADDTVISYGKTSGGSVSLSVKMPTEGNIDVWGAYAGTPWQTTAPPSQGYLGAITGTTSYYVYNPKPYSTVTTLSMPTKTGVGKAVTATIKVTTPANAMAAKPNGMKVTLYQQKGASEDTSIDTVLGTATLVNGAASMQLTPSEFGTYKYYVTFPGLPATSSTTPPAVYLPSSSAAVSLSADYSCATLLGTQNASKIKADNSSTDPATGFNCAYTYSTGSRSLGVGFTDNMFADSDVGFQHISHCITKTSGFTNSTKVTQGTATTASQINWSVTSVGVPGSWGAGVLWMAPTNSAMPLASQFQASGNSCSNYQLPVNLLADPTVKLSLPSGLKVGTAAVAAVSVTTNPVITVMGAAVNVYQMLGAMPAASDPKVGSGTVTSNGAAVTITPQTGALAFYAVMDPSNYASPSLKGSGWTGWATGISAIAGPAYVSSSAVTRAVDVTPRPAAPPPVWSESQPVTGHLKSQMVRTTPRSSLVTPIVVQQQGKGDLSVSCPTGTVVQNFFAGSAKATFGPDKIAVGTNGRVTLTNKGGHRAVLQVSCRPATAAAVIEGRTGQGSARADVMVTVTDKSIFLGGPGDDRMTASHPDSTLAGGLGADLMIASAARAVLSGGPGDDELRADGGRALLNGGAGKDTFLAGSGVVLINARDGRGGDVIRCSSTKNRYIADKGDVIEGPCTPIGS